MTIVAVAYIPVLHEGYKRFIQENAANSQLYLIGPEFTSDMRALQKDIRVLNPAYIKLAVESWGIASDVSILTQELALFLAESGKTIVLPDEDISRMIVDRFFKRCEVVYDSVFLRWDTRNTVLRTKVNVTKEVDITDQDLGFIQKAAETAQKSSDWWRQVGAVLARDGKILEVGYNKHMPSPQTPYVDGDPRSNFFKGVHIELSTAIHAEASVIARAARYGVALEGCDMFVTTFPCPPCAKLVAESGIRRLFFIGDYSMLDGEKVLTSRGVELIRVNIENPPTA